MTAKARRIINDLFQAFIADSRLLPPQLSSVSESERARSVADYIAGMTDRYAIKEHRRLFSVEE
jgi:dGTPase